METKHTPGPWEATKVNWDRTVIRHALRGDAGKVYFSSSELRAIAQDLIEVAECLDKRADGA